jgi:hypothetical protein
LQRQLAARANFALPIELQQLSPLAGLEPATVVRSNSRLGHSAKHSAAGIIGPGICPLLYPLSYGSSRCRQESNLQPSDPEVTRAFTTPQDRKFDPSFLPPYFITSCLRTHP